MFCTFISLSTVVRRAGVLTLKFFFQRFSLVVVVDVITLYRSSILEWIA